MSSPRSLLSSVFSWTFLAGILSGAGLTVGGFFLFAWIMVAHFQPGGAAEGDALSTPDVPTQEVLPAYGTVPSDWTLRPATAADSTTFGALAAEGPVVVNVWATWCAPCREEMPTLQALHDSTGQDTRVVLVSTEARTTVRDFVEKNEYAMPVYVAETVPGVLNGRAIPRTYVVRPGDRQVVYRHVGAADWNAESVHGFLDRVAPAS